MRYLWIIVVLFFSNLVKSAVDKNIQRVKRNANIQVDAKSDDQPARDLRAQQKSEKVRGYIKSPMGFIAGSKECGDDVIRLCGSKKYNGNDNFQILSCLVDNQDTTGISKECNRYLWQYKKNVTTNQNYGKIAQKLCKQALVQSPECISDKLDGRIISCLFEKRDSIKEQGCISFLTKFQSIIFSDFHLICDFVEQCDADIKKYKCESVEKGDENDEFAHSQGQVVACLEKELVKDTSSLKPDCFKQIIRIAELSADDYHLDRALYFKCRKDRENLCGDVAAGQGKVYQCLFNHKFDSQMSFPCRDALTARQKVQAIDYKANSALLRECKRDITKGRCNATVSEDHLVHLSSVLLCLEKNKRTTPLSDRCEQELIEFRRMLMEDYEISPEISLHCAADVNERCDAGTQAQGKTLHCLMALARSEEHSLQPKCQEALGDLLQETGALDDYRMDPVLVSACKSTISRQCSDDHSDDGTVLTCLMDHLHDRDMKKKCKSALLDLQYFVSRDFSLDPTFREACHVEADRCDPHTDKENPINFNFVLACLYARLHTTDAHNVQHDPLSPKCAEEVHRIIRQRALDVHLNPELEAKCRRDLSLLCSNEKHEENTEFVCLQESFEKITSSECKKEVESLTKLESENFLDFDEILAKECEPMLKKYCQKEADDGDEGGVVECLITNKDVMESEKCAAGVAHFQLIEMKNYNFNYKFTKACKGDVNKFCDGVTNKAKVVECLSKLVRDRVLAGDQAHKVDEVSSKCRSQLTVEKLQMHANIEFNPDLHKSCIEDAKRLCPKVNPGSALLIECIRRKKKEIKNKACYKSLFEFEKEEIENPKLDFTLMKKCRTDIHSYCETYLRSGDSQKIMECLLEYKEQLKPQCKQVIREREKDIFDDIELNIDLQTSCKDDLQKFCKQDLKEAREAHEKGDDPHGVVYSCLIDVYTSDSGEKVLSDNCYSHVGFVIKEEQRDYELNPALMIACVHVISQACPPKESNVIECLEKKFLDGEIKDTACMMVSSCHKLGEVAAALGDLHVSCAVSSPSDDQVAILLRESRSDIQADPLMNEACSSDVIKFCPNIREGHGKVIQCLIGVQSSLSKECAQILSERKEMWKHVKEVRREYKALV